MYNTAHNTVHIWEYFMNIQILQYLMCDIEIPYSNTYLLYIKDVSIVQLDAHDKITTVESYYETQLY